MATSNEKPTLEFKVNGLLGKIVSGVATTVLGASVIAGASGIWVAAGLARDFEKHVEEEADDRSEIKVKLDKLWEQGIRDETMRREYQKARDEQRQFEKKLDALLIKRGIDPEKIE